MYQPLLNFRDAFIVVFVDIIFSLYWLILVSIPLTKQHTELSRLTTPSIIRWAPAYGEEGFRGVPQIDAGWWTGNTDTSPGVPNVALQAAGDRQ